MNPILLPRKERNASAEWARNVRESVTSPKSPDLGRDDLRGNATITWVSVTEDLPDDDCCVLLALADGEVWTGFRDASEWRYVSADLIEAEVTHWAHFPEPPKTNH